MPLKYTVRGFYPHDLAEVERVNLMYYHPQVAKAKGYHTRGFGLSADQSLHDQYEPLDDSRLLRRRQKSVSFAVADSRDKLVGWVWFYLDTRHPLPRRVQSKLGLKPQTSISYQVSYEKLLSEGWPKRLLSRVEHTPMSELTKPRKGVIVEGLRLAIARLKRRYLRRYIRALRIVLYAYVLPDNIPSQRVLESNGFVREEKLYRYDRVAHQLWVSEV